MDGCPKRLLESTKREIVATQMVDDPGIVDVYGNPQNNLELVFQRLVGQHGCRWMDETCVADGANDC